jgi:lysophospholipase L1-like esterase
MTRRKPIFWTIYSVLLLCAALVGAELIAWLLAPTWPGYLLRPAPVSTAAVAQWSGGMPDVTFAINNWQMRDRERSIAKPPTVGFRALLVGDSFLEGGFTRAALPARIEGRLVEAQHDDIEVVNLGVAGTGPIEYYYRIREVGLALSPDAVVLTFYSGNDTVSEPFPLSDAPRPFIAELPRPSILGSVAPHLAWHAVNALRLSGAARGGKYAPNEHEIITQALGKPRAEGLPMIVRLMHDYYFPQADTAVLNEVLARGGDRFWSEFVPRRFDREYLQGWILDGLISSEISTQPLPLTDAEAEAAVPVAEIDATMSWLLATNELLRARGVKFLVAVAPVGDVDPDFAEFWQPWPRYYAFTRSRSAMHKAMVGALARAKLPFVDLRPTLEGVRGTYRKSDLHWTERGHEVVAERLAQALLSLR